MMLALFAFALSVSALPLLPSAKEVCGHGNGDMSVAQCMRLMATLNRVARNSNDSVLALAAAQLGNDPDNCANNADECDCTWGDEAQCGTAIGGCIAACTTVALCAACLVALGPACQDCACYYVCGYEGPGKLSTKICPQQYYNCTDS